MKNLPKITFGIIVLNGEPFTRYCLRSLYPFAHEIIVVEGASEKAATIATPDGHSIDSTLKVLKDFKAVEDHENKLMIITAEDYGYSNGFWRGEKDEQSKAYAKLATGDYLWQVDIDEFYKPEDMEAILTMVHIAPSITQMNVQWLNFWGGFDYLVDGVFLKQHYRDLGGGVPRLFKWGTGYRYITHRPPTVIDANGIDMRHGKWMHGDGLAQRGIYCYHYGSVFPKLVNQKMQYYSQQEWKNHDKFNEWYQTNFMQIRYPFRIHHVVDDISWLCRFNGTHPPQIQQLIFDLRKGEISIHLRETKDIELLLSARRFQLGVFCFKVLTPMLLKLQNHLPQWKKMLESMLEKLFSPSIYSWPRLTRSDKLTELINYYKAIPWVALLRAIEIKQIRTLNIRCKSPALDLGCGDGLVAKLAFNHQLDVGIDINRNALLEAQQYDMYQKICQVDARFLPFKNNMFYTVYSNCAMEHMNDLDSVLSEISRVLKIGGILITLVPSHKVLDPVGMHGKLFGNKLWNAYNKIHNHINLLSAEQWHTKLNDHGMSIKYIREYGCKTVAEYIMNSDFLSKFHLGSHWPFFRLQHGGNCMRLFSLLQPNEKQLLHLYYNDINQIQDGYWLIIHAEKI